MQMPARTPAMTAMTAMTLRSFPATASSSASALPARRWSKAGTACLRQARDALKEYVQIMRQVFAREQALSFDGKDYQSPIAGPAAPDSASR